MQHKTLLALPLILALASPAQADDHKALLAKCDIDRNGVINAPASNLPPQAWATIETEQVCQHEFELDQLAKDSPDIRKRCDLNGNGRIDHHMPLIALVMMAGKESNARQAWRNLPEDVRKPVDAEKKCVTDASIAQKDASIAQKDASIAQKYANIAQKDASIAQKYANIARIEERIAKLDDENQQMLQILAMLNPAEAKAFVAVEIQSTEKDLQQARDSNDQRRIVSLEDRLRVLRERQKTLK